MLGLVSAHPLLRRCQGSTHENDCDRYKRPEYVCSHGQFARATKAYPGEMPRMYAFPPALSFRLDALCYFVAFVIELRAVGGKGLMVIGGLIWSSHCIGVGCNAVSVLLKRKQKQAGFCCVVARPLEEVLSYRILASTQDGGPPFPKYAGSATPRRRGIFARSLRGWTTIKGRRKG